MTLYEQLTEAFPDQFARICEEAYRTQDHNTPDLWKLEPAEATPCAALRQAFIWRDSVEGMVYWATLAYRKDLPQSEAAGLWEEWLDMTDWGTKGATL